MCSRAPEWSDTAIAEGLLCDTSDNVIGGTMSNLFVARNGTLPTPALADCGVSGVMRDVVIELAQTHRVPLHITTISMDELLAADEVFVVNSVIGVWPVIALGRKTWETGALTMQIQRRVADVQGA